MHKILLINGPNLNLLGNIEKEIYGGLSLKDIEEISKNKSKELNIKLNFCQSRILSMFSNGEYHMYPMVVSYQRHDSVL